MKLFAGYSVAAAALLAAGSLLAQSAKPVPPSSEVYKNLKVLGATPSDSLNQGMHLISGELGVECTYCHTDQKWELEGIKAKDTARDMMTMMMEINRRNFKGEQAVTCYTCHQGKPIPTSTIALPMGEYLKEKEPGSEPALPPAEQLISKYIAAIGGEQNIRKITSRMITATQDLPTGPGGTVPSPGTVEIYQKAPNLVLRIAKTKDVTQTSGADSKGPWVQDARGRVNPPAIDVERIRETRNADFYDALDIAKEYPKLKTEAIEKVNGSDAYVVLGEPKDGLPMRFYFDVKTGLLVRRRTETPTHSGLSPFQVDYSEYRDAGHGVKYPYRIHNEPAGPRTEIATHSTIRITKLQENVAIEDAKFERPPSVDRGGKKKQ